MITKEIIYFKGWHEKSLSGNFIALFDTVERLKELKRKDTHRAKIRFLELVDIFISLSFIFSRGAGGTDSRRTFGSGRLAVIDRVEPVISV